MARWQLALSGVFLGLALTACDDDVIVEREAFLELSPESIDFGTIELTQQRIEAFELANREGVRGEIASVTLEDDCGGCFTLLDQPAVIEAVETLSLRVRYRPVVVGEASGTLTVNGSSPEVTLEAVMTGTGVDGRKPDVAVTPTAVDFGFVPAGGVAVGSFTVRSTGGLDLLVDRISIDPPDAPFRITTSTPTPAMPGQLAPGTSAQVGLRAELGMTETGTRTARILVETNVLDEKNVPGRPGVVAVPLSALGNLPPVAVVGDDLVVEPFTEVQLDGTGSFDQDDPPNLPLTYRWTLADSPGGSRAEFVRSTTAEPVLRPDLAGRYELDLVVVDGLGLESEPARLAVEAFPDEAIRIELIWDHPDSDLDLHLIRSGGTFCDCATTVHYRDCARSPDWFPMTPGANPSLDLDDRSGFGPENINFEGDGTAKFVPEESFTLAVHYFSNASQVSSWPTTESNATVRVFIFGLLAAEATRTMVNEREVWIVGTLEWPSQTFNVNGTVVEDAVCGAL
ncbi:MAG: choice-of-anchor D domain-containing protein [Myxococcota bacterium]